MSNEVKYLLTPFIMYMKRAGWILIILIIAGNAKAVNVSLNSGNVYKDEIFDVDILVNPEDAAIAGIQTDVLFDNTTLTLISVKQGNMLKGKNAYFTVLSQNSTYISNIIGVVLGNASITTKDVFATITFRAKDSGKAFVELRNLKISDNTGKQLDVNLSNVRFTILKSENNIHEGSTGGGAGGGTGIASDENPKNIEFIERYSSYIYKNVTTAYCFRRTDNPILCINITGNTSAGEVTTLVEVLKNTSSIVRTPPPYVVYKNLNIWVGSSGFAVPKNIKHAEITFRVEKAWIIKNSIDSVVMMRYDRGWHSLPTQKIKENEAYYYYKATTTAFSPFAITGRHAIMAGLVQEIPVAKKQRSEESERAEPTADYIKVLLIIVIVSGIYLLIHRLFHR